MNLHQKTSKLMENVAVRTLETVALLTEIVSSHNAVSFASSLGAEDMLLTDLIVRNALQIEVFSLDTGRLPLETYDLMARIQQHYGLKLKIYYPRHEAVEQYVGNHGINAFYNSIELRRACCTVRKVEPLRRALAGKDAWVTGMRAHQSATRAGLQLKEYDDNNGLWKYNPLYHWEDREIWAYIRAHHVPYNKLHDKFYPSIGCAPCTRPVGAGEDVRAGRWWWENVETRECGLHVRK